MSHTSILAWNRFSSKLPSRFAAVQAVTCLIVLSSGNFSVLVAAAQDQPNQPVPAVTVHTTDYHIGPNNYLSAQEPFEEQRQGNGTATIKGWETLHRLPAMTLSQLEAQLGINLHDAAAPDFGRFHTTKNAWYREHKAGASYDDGAPRLSEVTLKGNVLCNRATISVPWNGSDQTPDHIPVLYAFEGTPEITAQLHTLLNNSYPVNGLDVETARAFLSGFTTHLEYFVAPGPLTAKIHKEVEWGSQILALTGTVYEKDGRRWIDVHKYAPASLTYPPKLIAPDKPFSTPHNPPLRLKVNEKLTLRCLPIPAGRFLQGSPFYQQRYQDEFPHEVVLTKSYYMAETPVTQEVFEAVLGKNPSPVKGPQCPVEGATWADVQEFCRILSAKNGRKVRVPTDAEWEYAARIGTSNPCFTEKYRDQISTVGVKGSDTPVKSKKPNAWGLYDMLCGGWHLTSNYKADNTRTKEIDPQGPPRGDSSIQTGSAGPMHKSRGGFHYSFIRPNMHGAVSEEGGLWEGGTQIFRIVVEAEAQ